MSHSRVHDPSEADRASSVTLEIAVLHREEAWALDIQDDVAARRVPLTRERLIVGSSRRADITIDDPCVSSRHCALCVAGNRVSVQDLGSKNGTFVGGARITEAWASAGTTITIGRTSLTCTTLGPHTFTPDEELDAPLPGVAGASVEMRRLARQVRRLARHSAPVLISGESGTGKELVARALYLEGPRADRPFVAVNVAALPRELVESEMFGHERGAFTGAVARRAGAFVEADGGTLFLDEIGELPLEAQPKLLRALDGYEVRRVGAAGAWRPANVRVVAATHAPLEDRVSAGTFRRDLYHRLEVFVVHVPPLRARPGDVAPIARELLRQTKREVGERELSSAALARLAAHAWPGNVRELRNVLYRAADLAAGEATIDARHVEIAMRPKSDPPASMQLTPGLARALYAQHGRNLSAASRAAGCPRSTFRKMLKRA
jgi:DNA-binding NtrC family response regulator